MSEPQKHEVVLAPPQPGMERSPKEIYKYLYEIWKRTGGFESHGIDLKGLNVSTEELNMLIGVRTDITVQRQLDSKSDITSLGTMAFQNASNVNITGGNLSGVTLASSTMTNSTMTNSAISGGTLDSVAITGSTFTTGTISNSDITIRVGGTTTDIPIGGTLHVDTTPVGTVGTGEDTLITYAMPANALNANDQYLEIYAWGVTDAGVTNKEVKLKIGSTTLIATGLVSVGNSDWSIRSRIVRTGSNTAQAITSIVSFAFPDTAFYWDVTEDFTTSLNIFCTGQGSATNDVIQQGMLIKWFDN